MVNVCPMESDPRQNVAAFVSDGSVKSIAGLAAEGLESLMSVIEEEVRKQDPDSEMIRLDADVLSDEDITFQRDLDAYLSKRIVSGRKNNIMIAGDLPVIGWNEAVRKHGGPDVQVYCGSLACRHVPMCVKMFRCP